MDDEFDFVFEEDDLESDDDIPEIEWEEWVSFKDFTGFYLLHIFHGIFFVLINVEYMFNNLFS